MAGFDALRVEACARPDDAPRAGRESDAIAGCGRKYFTDHQIRFALYERDWLNTDLQTLYKPDRVCMM
jgi:hypothetical protein